jgi:hypothetical protein
MGFAEIALPLAERGVAVVPTDPGLRFPFRKNWPRLGTNRIRIRIAARLFALAASASLILTACGIAKL